MKTSKHKSTTKLIPIIFGFIIILALAAYIIFHKAPYTTTTITISKPHFTFNNSTYNFTSVASTLQEQEQGLMNTTVDNSTFELFVFAQSSIYPFWMKDTYSPLDIIWINGTKVTYIASAIPCSSYSSNQTACIIYNNYSQGHAANYVIEAQLGFVNRTGMRVGSAVYISN